MKVMIGKYAVSRDDNGWLCLWRTEPSLLIKDGQGMWHDTQGCATLVSDDQQEILYALGGVMHGLRKGKKMGASIEHSVSVDIDA
jgi:hypothetical protein